MNMKQAVTSVLKNWNDFRGRACRSEFWYFFLAYVLVSVAASYVDIASGTMDFGTGDMYSVDIAFGGMGLASIIINLLLLIPSLAVTSRRLQDRGHSGWWQLSYLTGIGAIVILVVCAMPARDNENKWGSNPLI